MDKHSLNFIHFLEKQETKKQLRKHLQTSSRRHGTEKRGERSQPLQDSCPWESCLPPPAAARRGAEKGQFYGESRSDKYKSTRQADSLVKAGETPSSAQLIVK